MSERWVPDGTERDRAGEGQHSPEITDEIASDPFRLCRICGLPYPWHLWCSAQAVLAPSAPDLFPIVSRPDNSSFFLCTMSQIPAPNTVSSQKK
jgi:hypothetical protein